MQKESLYKGIIVLYIQMNLVHLCLQSFVGRLPWVMRQKKEFSTKHDCMFNNKISIFTSCGFMLLGSEGGMSKMCMRACVCLFANTQSIIMIVNIGAIMLHGVFMRFVLLSQWTILFSHMVNTECI
jgi:hypothetical protein